MAKLVVLSEGQSGRACELKSERTTIGRVDDNAFQIQEPSVSSHHCEVLLRGSDIVIKDLNSTNGTFINGEPVKEAVLKPGQILRLGQIEMRLENGAPPPAAAKKPLEQTRAMSAGGVKLNDLEQGPRQGFDKGSPFAKKSNKIAVIFITIGIVLGVIIIVSIFIAMQKIGG